MNSDWLTAKQPVWLFKNNLFTKSIVQSVTGDSVICVLQDGAIIQAKRAQIYQRNPYNNKFDPDRKDLMDTDVLNQPQILKILKFRLQNRRIYTFVQNSLIIVNPYTGLPELCSDQLKQQYLEFIMGNQGSIRDPHLYAITSLMITELKRKAKSQAIVISGQSGAGKTESNKECLRFLKYYFSKQPMTNNSNEQIDKVISLANPILEAFGNSKTIRNNNSSRFGKYLSISLNRKHEIQYATIYNYLLEKSRIISRAPNEQNFHIFYQFIKYLPLKDKIIYFLVDQNAKQLQFADFNYLASQGTFNYEAHPDVSFAKVVQSLEALPDKTSYDYVCRTLAAVLFLGNLEPIEDQSSDKCLILPFAQFNYVCSLLQVDKSLLQDSLTAYTIKIGGDTLKKSFGSRDVSQLIRSLSKALYQKLFQWIIIKLNELSSPIQQEQQEDNLTLGFLDIYGFEILQSNSLQQLFINYTNERLHQIYLQKIFKEERLEYEAQNLIHKYRQIDFQDNIGIIELIDYDHLSIFNLLDEWCTMATPDQGSFITKLRYNHKKNDKFPPENFNLPSSLFLLRHSPKDIEYNVTGFRDKNKDLLRQEIKQAMKQSTLTNLASMFSQSSVQGDQQAKNHRMRKFLSVKFRKDLSVLTDDILSKSQLHFIRCLKPNSMKKALYIDQQVVYNQICYLGVLNTIKIKKMGYCMKIDYETLDRRFCWLVRYYFKEPAFPKEIEKAIMTFLPRFGEEDIICGRKKMFFKDYAYTALAIKYSKYIYDLKAKTYMIQSFLVRSVYSLKKERKRNAVKIISQYILSYSAAKTMQKFMEFVLLLQLRIRQCLRQHRVYRKENSIIVLQSYFKRSLADIIKNKKLTAANQMTRIMQGIICHRRFKNERFVAHYICDDILGIVWSQIIYQRIKVIQQYLLSFRLRVSRKKQIAQANFNSICLTRNKNMKCIQRYLVAWSINRQIKLKLTSIIKVQCTIKGWLFARQYQILKQAAIIIQRCFRQYYKHKCETNKMLRQYFSDYLHGVVEQNKSIQSFLYYCRENSGDTIEILYRNYFSKFKSKLSLIYVVVDFQAFVNLETIYPGNSWLMNYFQIMKDAFERDNPVQSLQLGETFTVAATTNRVYLWGLNQHYKTLQAMQTIKTKNKFEVIRIEGTKVQTEVGRQDVKIFSTVNRAFNFENGRLFECCEDHMQPIKIPYTLEKENSKVPRSLSLPPRIIEVACGSGHVILRGSTKKVYTFGQGTYGQLGHGKFCYEQSPKCVTFSQALKNYHPIQISASFNSSIVLFSNRKLVWFGKNGTINRINVPTLFDIQSKFQLFNQQFCPIRIQATWNRGMSIIGLTLLSYNSNTPNTKMSSNTALRSKVTDLLISKWHQVGIDRINPPYNPSYTDYLQECHVKLPINKINIEPQGRRKLKQLQDKVKSISSDRYAQISFSDAQKVGYFK